MSADAGDDYGWPEGERLLVQRQIAGILDHPSVYVGGPSRQSMEKAGRVIAMLERSERIVSTTCEHAGWTTYRQHGTYCPDCGSDLHKTSES